MSVDGGETWRSAEGRGDWTYTFTPTVEGPLNVQTRAADDSSNLETPGSGVFFTVGDGPADTTPPTVTDTSPVDGATDVPVGKTLSVTFDEDVAAGSVSWTVSGPSAEVPGSTGYAAGSQTASFDPADALDAQTSYTVTVEGARDASGNVMEPLSWSFTTGEADTTPPTVTEKSPADAAVDVALDAVLTATFDEDVVADSPSWTVSGNGTPIAGSTSYNATTRTASFQPDTKLGAATTYSATITGARDSSGNTTDPVLWSFTTVDTGPAPSTIFGDEIPAGGSDPDTSSVELGVKFVVDEPGFITGVRFYKGTANTGTHVGNLWDSSGGLLASATFTDESGSGWQEVAFASPVAVEPGQTYVASYFAPNGRYHGTNSFFSGTGAGSAPIRALADGVDGGNGVYRYGSSSAFPSSSWNASNYWVDAMFTTDSGPDLVAPSLTGTTPSDGAVDVALDAPVTATFDEPVDGSTVDVTLTTADGPVAGNFTYNAGTDTVAYAADDPLAASTVHTATISGAEDAAGNVMDPVSFTFTTVAADVTAPSVTDTSPVDGASDVALGKTPSVTFDEDVVAGSLSWSVSGPGGAIAGSTSYAAGTRMASFDPAAALDPETTYTVTVQGGRDAAGNVMSAATWSFTTRPVDVTPPSVISTNPADGVNDVPLSSAVSVTFDEDLASQSVAMTLTGPGGAVAGATAYEAGTRTATFTPADALGAGTGYSVSVSGEDLAGNALGPVSWSFTTSDVVAVSASIFGDAVPPSGASSDPGSVELGVKFVVDEPGFVTGVRFYKGTPNTGTHVGNLWDSAGGLLASATFTGESGSGWQEVAFASPVAVEPGQTYVASYFAPNGRYHADSGFFATGGAGAAPIRALADGVDGGNGVYRYGSSSGFPSSSWRSANYWVDALFQNVPPDSTPPTVSTITPLDGAVDVAVDSPVTATFSESVQEPVGFTLVRTSDQASVVATQAYDDATRTVRLTPSAPLEQGTEYTVTVTSALDLAGNALAAPVTWTFTAEADQQPPAVSGIVPALDALDVPIDATVTVTFDEPVVESTVDVAVASAEGDVSGAVSYDPASRTASFSAVEVLAGSTTYTVTVSGTRDESGNAMDPYTWSFTTVAPDVSAPTVVATSPVDGQVDVDRGTVITATFDEDIVAASAAFALEDVAGPVTGSVSYDAAARTASFEPDTGLASDSVYTVTLSGVTDISGNQTDAVSWSFTTADTEAPTVTDRSPDADATAIARDTTITATFDEPVDEPSLGVVVAGPNGAVGGTTGYAPASRTVTYQPTSPLDSATKYTVTVQASDQAGNDMDPVSWSFTTADTVAPSVTSTTPQDGSTEVPVTALIAATFDEDVVGASVSLNLTGPAGDVAGATSYVDASRTVTFDAAQDLVFGVEYLVDLTGAEDAAGNAMDPVSWTFTTASAPDTTSPAVVSTSPEDGEIDVAPSTVVTATFTEDVDPASILWDVTGPTSAVAGGTSYDVASRTATFTSDAPFVSDAEYSVSVTGATDPSGNVMSPLTWSFVVADVAPPTVVDRTPAADATNVPVDSVVTATFDENIPTGAVTIDLKQGQDVVAGSTSYDDATRTVTLQPDATLASSTGYTVTVRAEDASGNLSDPVTWSFSTADVVAPLVVDTSPADEAVDVAADVTLTATFNEAMKEPVSMSLQRDSDGSSVVATVSYDAATKTAALKPSAALASGTGYSVSVSGEDLAGNALGPVSWSFTTSDVVAVSASIFGDAVPPSGASSDPGSVELGVKFVVDEPGFVTGVRFYKGTPNTGTHVGNLWDSAGGLLASATFTGESGSGWQEVAFASPVAVAPGQTYVASYFAPNGRYHADSGFFATGGAGAAPIRALADGVDGGNGVYRYGSSSGFPSSTWRSANYWVDALFSSASGPDTVAPSITGTSPVDAAEGVLPEAQLRGTFSEPVSSSSVSWDVSSSQGQVAGSAAYDAATQTATFQPDDALTAGTTYTVTISGATDLVGNVMADTTWEFTTSDSTTGCPCSLWPDAAPPNASPDPDTNPIEVGVKFRSSIDGYITGLRFYKFSANVGTHTGHLWDQQGTLLATATFANETASGWQQVRFARPIPVTAEQVYVASYFAPSGRYASTQNYFDGEQTNGPLTAPASAGVGGNGVYAFGGGQFPTSTYKNENYWVDVVFDTSGLDFVQPSVKATTPRAGAVDVPVGSSVRVTFDEPVQQPVSVTLVRKSDQASVAADISYDVATNTATLVPWVPLDGLTEYTATVAAPIDEAGNTGDPLTWSFTTWDPQLNVDPRSGPNDAATTGPLLLVTSAANPSSQYLAEILRAEGLNHFAAVDVQQMTLDTLDGFDAVVLGEADLTGTQAQHLRDFVTGGGNLVAMRPDAQLADLFGVVSAGGTRQNAYLKVETDTGPGVGITGETIQYKGAADLYTLDGAASVADLYLTASQSTPNPAVTLASVGGNGGQAGMFSYDLARSIVLQRQGNPAWAGQERDGSSPIRSDDQYFGGASDTDWVDLSKAAIPQADEQQRLLANMLIEMTADRAPMPRFFYFPNFTKAVVVATGDDHANGGTAGRFDSYLANSPDGCDDSKWECPRFTSYIYPSTPLDPAEAADYEQAGFEVGAHISTNCQNFDRAGLEAAFASDLGAFGAKYPDVAAPRTNRTHCIAWSDWASTPLVSEENGVRLDTNYYYWPGDWVADRPGFMTGSGMPMRFADTDGTLINVYQAATQMTDESGQSYPYTPDALLDRALGPEGFYGAFVTNHHTEVATIYEDDATLASAQARGVPVITSARLLDWTDGRNASAFRELSWTGDELSFDITTASGSDGITAMLPSTTDSQVLSGLSRAGQPVSYTLETVKGIEYAVFPGVDGAYVATYSGSGQPAGPQQVASYGTSFVVPALAPADMTSGAVFAQDAASDPTDLGISDVAVRTTAGGQATLTWTTNLPAASGVKYGTDPYSQTMTARTASPRREHELTLTGLQSGATYYYTIVAQRGDDRTTWPAAGETPSSFVAQSPLSTSLTVDSAQVSPLPGTGVVVSWNASRPATALIEYGVVGGPLDRVGRTSDATSRGQLVLTGLERDETYEYRLTLTDAAGRHRPLSGRRRSAGDVHLSGWRCGCVQRHVLQGGERRGGGHSVATRRRASAGRKFVQRLRRRAVIADGNGRGRREPWRDQARARQPDP